MTVETRFGAVEKFITTISEGTPEYTQALFRQRLHIALAIPHQTRDMETIPDYDESILYQDGLGWINFIRGRHSIHFQLAYSQYLADLPDKTRKRQRYKTGIALATMLIIASLTLLVEIWYDRNTQVNINGDEDEAAVSPRR